MITAADHKKNTVPWTEPRLLLSVTSLCWLAAKLTGWKLWIIERSFPVVPPVAFFSGCPAILHWMLFIASIILLVFLMARPGNRTMQCTLLFIELCSCLLDQNRWQPWEYLYLFILLIFIVTKNKKAAVSTSFSLLLATIYFYSGIHKFNEGFLANVWEKLFLKNYVNIPATVYHTAPVHYGGYLLAAIECLSGAGLLFTATKKTAALSLMAMHFFILLVIGPLGLHYNKIVWPWNVAMLCYLYLIFIKNSAASLTHTGLLNRPAQALLLCWVILPAFNFIGLWDNYLSWNIYSSTIPKMFICIKDAPVPGPVSSFVAVTNNEKICTGAALLNVQNWAMEEMEVPPYPEQRVYRKIKAQWTKDFPLSAATFTIYYFPFVPGTNPF